MLTRTIGRYITWPIDRIAALLAPTGIPPNFITWSALVGNFAAGILFARGRFAAAGGMMILAGICDLLDGPVARRQNRVSLFGAFLDSILDRYADLILFLGLLVYYALVNRFIYAMLAGAAMAGAVMVSYAKARAESLVPTSEIGFWERPERLVLMILGALVNRMPVALWILAIGPNLTVIHRILDTWKQTKEPDANAVAGSAGVNMSPLANGKPRSTSPQASFQTKSSAEVHAAPDTLSRSAGRGRS